MQEGKQPLWAGVQLFARLTLNAGEDAANQPARLAHLDDGNDRAILVQGHEGPTQIVRLGHRGTPSIDVKRRNCHLRRPPHSISPLEGRAFELPVRGRGPSDCRSFAHPASASSGQKRSPAMRGLELPESTWGTALPREKKITNRVSADRQSASPVFAEPAL